MKKNLHLSLTSVFIILLSIKALAVDVRQTWTWTGAAGDNLWSNGSNWSASPVDVHQSFPRNFNDALNNKNFIADVVFNGSATPSIIATYFVNSLAINSGTVNLVSSGATKTFYISNAASGASMTINAGATLQLGDASLGLIFEINTNGIVGTISGTLDLSGNGNSSNAPKFQNYGAASTSVTTVTSSGKVILSGSNAQVLNMRNTNFVFQSGAQLNITRNGGTIPGADYQSGSVINVTGCTTSITMFSTSDANFNGDINWNCPSQTVTGTSATASLSALGGNAFGGTFFMKAGYIVFQGTLSSGYFTNINVSGGTFGMRATSAIARAINGNITVSGGTFAVNHGDDFGGSAVLTCNLAGGITQTGGVIDLAPRAAAGVLKMAGNLSQTGGILTESGSTTTSSFQFTGSTIQNFTATSTISGDRFLMTINNANNHVNQLSNVTLPYRLQCSSGCMILSGTSLTVTEKVFGSRTGGRVVTNLGGTLTLKNVDNIGKDFPVGISTASHDAVWVTNASGTADFTVSVGSTFNPLANLNVTNTLPRQWEITSTSAGANLEFDPDPLAGTAPTNKSIGHYVGSAWVSTSAVIGVNNGYPYSANFTSFSPFVVGATDVIPVELTAFKAQSKGSSNLIEWATASEINTAYFNLERSANGHNAWQNIGTIKAAGNSNRPLSYNFTDEGPLSISYYRLTTVDADGKKTVSKTVSVHTGKGKLALLNTYPSPAKNVVNLDFDATPNTTVAIALKDMTGRAVLAKNTKITEGSNQLTLDVSGLANGVYILTMNDGVSSIVQRIVKQ